MKRISTPFSSSVRLFPILFCGVIGAILCLVVASNGWSTPPILVLFLIGFAVAGVFMWKANSAGLDAEVFDCDDHLLVRRDGQEVVVPFSDIVNVNFAAGSRPERITLTLARPGPLGSEIVFSPPPRFSLSLFPRNPVAQDLLARTIRARGA